MSSRDALREQTRNIRDYGMYIAFVVIVIFFTIATNGLFVSSRNIGNLVNATSYIAVRSRSEGAGAARCGAREGGTALNGHRSSRAFPRARSTTGSATRSTGLTSSTPARWRGRTGIWSISGCWHGFETRVWTGRSRRSGWPRSVSPLLVERTSAGCALMVAVLLIDDEVDHRFSGENVLPDLAELLGEFDLLEPDQGARRPAPVGA